MIVDREPQTTSIVPSNGTKVTEHSFKLVAVIGAAGKTGELFATTLADVPGLQVMPVLRGGIAKTLAHRPDAIIVATPNPTEAVLKEIADNAQNPITVILTQNGVDAVPSAQRTFEGLPNPVTIIRGSLYTNPTRNAVGELLYNADKKRIGLAAVGSDQGEGLSKAEAVLTQAGFNVAISSNLHAMEWGKLDVNMFGLTAAVTGLSPKETLRNKQLFKLEVQALRGRRRLLRAAGIPVSDIRWGRNLNLLEKLPLVVLASMPVRYLASVMFSKERNNQPPATATQIEEDKDKEKGERKPLEAVDYYYEPFLKLAAQQHLPVPIEKASQRILAAHQNNEFNLTHMEQQDRIKLLLDTVQMERVKTYTPGRKLLAIVAEGLVRYGLRSLQVTGEGNLEQMARYLENGQSVMLLANHSSHADHALLEMVLKHKIGDRLSEDSVVIIAGMLWGRDFVSRAFEETYPKIRVATTRKGTKTIEKFLAKGVNKRASRRIMDTLDEPKIVLVYPEGTRSKGLQKAIPASTFYFGHENTGGVFSAAITGTTDLLPPGDKTKKGFRGKLHNFVNSLRLFIPKRANVGVHFFEPTHPIERDRKTLDQMMYRIASGMPEEDRGPYSVDAKVEKDN